jgi:biopolymer transport protein ExbB/TolQ
VVAIPAAFLYNHFTRRMNVMLTEAENHTRNLRTILVSTQASQRREGASTRTA